MGAITAPIETGVLNVSNPFQPKENAKSRPEEPLNVLSWFLAAPHITVQRASHKQARFNQSRLKSKRWKC